MTMLLSGGVEGVVRVPEGRTGGQTPLPPAPVPMSACRRNGIARTTFYLDGDLQPPWSSTLSALVPRCGVGRLVPGPAGRIAIGRLDFAEHSTSPGEG